MRWQVYASLAHGSSGILFFCWWSPGGATFQWGGAIMTPQSPVGNTSAVEYVEGPKYALVARVNEKLGAFGTFLLNATSQFVFEANGTGASNASVVPAGAAVAALGGSGAGSAWSVLLGGFSLRGASSGTAFVLLNQDTVLPAVTSLVLGASAGTACELDASGARIPLRDDAPAMPGLQLFLAEGDARLLFFVPSGDCSGDTELP